MARLNDVSGVEFTRFNEGWSAELARPNDGRGAEVTMPNELTVIGRLRAAVIGLFKVPSSLREQSNKYYIKNIFFFPINLFEKNIMRDKSFFQRYC